MFEVFAHWEGIKEVTRALEKSALAANTAAQANVNQAATYLIRAAQSNFEGAHKKGEPHVGGAKPNIVTGNLRRSILAGGIRNVGPGTWANTVGPTAVYGRAVELGGRHSGSYPYFGPAVAQTRRELGRIASDNWARYML